MTLLPRPLALGIVVLVSAVWAVNFFARLLVADYDPDVSINGIFMVLVGGAVLASRRARARDDAAAGGPDDDTIPITRPDPRPPTTIDEARDLAAKFIQPPPRGPRDDERSRDDPRRP